MPKMPESRGWKTYERGKCVREGVGGQPSNLPPESGSEPHVRIGQLHRHQPTRTHEIGPLATNCSPDHRTPRSAAVSDFYDAVKLVQEGGVVIPAFAWMRKRPGIKEKTREAHHVPLPRLQGARKQRTLLPQAFFGTSLVIRTSKLSPSDRRRVFFTAMS